MSELNNQQLRDFFQMAFGHAADFVVRAPGRVNLIGEHTDYNDGFVLPAAINYSTWIALSSNQSRELTVVARDFDNQKVTFNIDEEMTHHPEYSWVNYVKGVVQALKKRGYALAGGNLFITGNVPAGAGLSSSASLEVAVVRALLTLSDEKIDPTDAALVGQAAENNFVGCNCGIMDQLISARGQESSALLIDCRDLSAKPFSIPADWEILIVHSGVKRGLVDSEYNQRREQCEAAAAFFGKTSLRDVSLAELLASEGKLDELSFKRARHVLTENDRTLLAADALSRGDMVTLSKAMAESHNSMRDDFNITTPAIDRLVEILQQAGNGQSGARMTGGGFGGCVVSIAPAAVIPQLMQAVNELYEKETGCKPTLIPAKASAGAFA